jgi:glycosyltransferase involved in cell wall biosynthesis
MENTVLPRALSIGVIIPVFNSGHVAINAVKSAVKQTQTTVSEILVVDDGSTDGSAEYIQDECDAASIAVRIIRIPNGGAANARNHGMQNCSCDLYAFLDSDDIWFNRKLERQLPAFKDPMVGMVGCLTTMGRGLSAKPSTMGDARTVSLREQLFKNHFQTSTVIVRRRVVDAVGAFPANQRYAEEGDFFNRVAANFKCVLLPEVLVDYANGKEGFGMSGLSANLLAMEKGELRNLLRVHQRGDCNMGLLALAISVSLLKFVRRYIISAIRSY